MNSSAATLLKLKKATVLRQHARSTLRLLKALTVSGESHPTKQACSQLLGVTGELVRQDILTGEKGAITHLDINIIDTSSCKPVTDAYVEMWGSNATGVYTGVQAKGNGDGSATAIATNALRGVQPTGANGTATFITLIPGHYVGRTNHLHSEPHYQLSHIH
jgi:protocatechuate 3,4-dioxygenase beta subunit